MTNINNYAIIRRTETILPDRDLYNNIIYQYWYFVTNCVKKIQFGHMYHIVVIVSFFRPVFVISLCLSESSAANLKLKDIFVPLVVVFHYQFQHVHKVPRQC